MLDVFGATLWGVAPFRAEANHTIASEVLRLVRAAAGGVAQQRVSSRLVWVEPNLVEDTRGCNADCIRARRAAITLGAQQVARAGGVSIGWPRMNLTHEPIAVCCPFLHDHAEVLPYHGHCNARTVIN